MNNTVRRTIALLGATWMAAQFVTATPTNALSFPLSSSSFEQALPVTTEQKEVERLMKQISANATTAAKHSDKLDSYARLSPRLSKATHSAELNGAKAAINAMGADFRKLEELRPSALPWQQTMIDRMGPMLAGLAGQTTEAIGQLNAGRWTRPSEEYREAVANMFLYTGQLRTLISVNLDYAQAREKLNRLDASTSEPVANVLSSDAAAPMMKASKTLEQRVQSELLKLPYYGVFDHLTFQVDGSNIVLSGDVTRPTLKSDAERVVSRLEGVTGVTNDIKVLPLSSNDDRIRIAAYWAIYGQPSMARYRLNPNPPIRIIVENGHMTLKGVVGSDMERTIAQMQANSVPGAFSVTNHLQIGS